MSARRRHHPLHCLTQRAPRAPDAGLAPGENIMRGDIFHSTLDGQTREQLADAAPQAFAMLQNNHDLCASAQGTALAVFHRMRFAPTLSF